MLSGAPPFYSKDRNEMFKNILEKPIPMKPYFSQEASSLLNGLLCVDPKRRLGYSNDDAQEIKSHPFFGEIDWDKILNKKYLAPFKPKVSGPLDLRHFDKMFTDETVRDTPMPSQGVNDQDYQGFTYVKNDLQNLVIENPNFGFEK
eukprot:TRINITY_DN2668_c0_g1_i2.p1 TRINITY_DN2668_c0_g1~~TRINITY_DN2668_c0_g1_i2.p1  ORF type:complete len:146 (-),score=19.08 TRINITY_DN2668_c0_g1_i2:52-489(-)